MTCSRNSSRSHSSEADGFMLVLEVGDIFWGPNLEGLGGEYNPPPEREDGPGRSQARFSVRG